MRWKVVTLVAGLLVAQAGAALAQYGESKWEISPLAGYRWGGGLSTVTGFREIDMQDNYVYGVGLGMLTPKNSSVEVQWTHMEGDLTGTTTGGVEVKSRNVLKRDDIMLNGYWYAYNPDASVKPYFTAGLGAAVFSATGLSTIGRFSWQLGLGLRADMNEGLALRLGGKWTPVWVTTGSGVWCDPFYCYSVGTGENFDQWEASATLILKL
jgi:opacity protein-like surface antigen